MAAHGGVFFPVCFFSGLHMGVCFFSVSHVFLLSSVFSTYHQ